MAVNMDSALVEKAQKGDTQAFEQLVRLHQNKVYGIAIRMTGNPEDAEDAAQDAFVRAWEKLPSFRGDCAFLTWLYRLTTNVCLDHLNARSRRKAVSLSADDDIGSRAMEIPDDAPGPQEQVEKSERAQALRGALDRLPADARQIVVLRESEGLSYDEIGLVLELPAGTVKSRLFRAREKLREDLSLHNGNIFVTGTSKDCNQMEGGGEL